MSDTPNTEVPSADAQVDQVVAAVRALLTGR